MISCGMLGMMAILVFTGAGFVTSEAFEVVREDCGKNDGRWGQRQALCHAWRPPKQREHPTTVEHLRTADAWVCVWEHCAWSPSPYQGAGANIT